jgi:hypothetical protein
MSKKTAKRKKQSPASVGCVLRAAEKVSIGTVRGTHPELAHRYTQVGCKKNPIPSSLGTKGYDKPEKSDF